MAETNKTVIRSTPNKGKKMKPKEVIGRMYAAARSIGMKIDDFDAIVKKAGFLVTTRTLRNWERRILVPGVSGTHTRNVGRPKIFDDKMEHLIIGYTLSQIDIGSVVTPYDIRSFIKSKLNLTVCTRTVRNYMKRFDISLRLAKRAQGGLNVDLAQLGSIYRSWILEQRTKTVFPPELCCIGSIDCTYTRHTTSRIRSYSPKGW